MVDSKAGSLSLQSIEISLAFAPTATKQIYQTLSVKPKTTIHQALKQVGWLDDYVDLATWCENNKNVTDSLSINNKSWRVGVYSLKKPLNYELGHQDRVEVYRALKIDPQHRRKVRART